jgi:thymidylate synthase
MFAFTITDPNKGLFDVTRYLLKEGVRTESRNGPVIRFPEPVALQYPFPRRRILDWEVRDANHFFHHFETMWMFAGREDVASLEFFNSKIGQYSDDGKILRGTAYGKRWRSHFGFDQLEAVICRLKETPQDRRCVLTMWDVQDLRTDTQDFACNMQVIFTTRPAESNPNAYFVDMLVTNRSNDLIYGSMGSNLFHFSMLHEYVASRAGLILGTYTQMSTNLHAYTENPVAQRVIAAVEREEMPPESPEADTSMTELGFTGGEPEVTADCNALVGYSGPGGLDSPYLVKVALPLRLAYQKYKKESWAHELVTPSKEERVRLAQAMLSDVPSPLGAAGAAWLERRL